MTPFRRLALVLLCAAGGAAYIGINLNTPYAGFNREAFVDLPKGTGARQMATLLGNSGVIRHSWTFLAARALRRGATLQAGEYRFTQPASVLEIFDRIERGDIFYYDLVVPEGKNMFDIAAAAERLGIFSAERFLEAARNPAAIRDLDPQAPTLEGYLFPNSYRLNRSTTPEQLCLAMTGKFREVWLGLRTDASVHRIVTLASLVEKEGKLPNERPIIASVFTRRLSIGMKLDCDPTTIYAALLAGNYRGAIHKSDLASGDPYNTYQHAGLPPGPIANPGAASIAAVLHPADTDYLYFVARADGSGGHNFSANLAAHAANVVKYRRNTAQRP
ncbi:MAG TPA: endolytic transglycosylase MltG [Bryobacteraceae bacterium]|nr:endolytic transglycosylase MltG [Bryobacteraceae bacterium]